MKKNVVFALAGILAIGLTSCTKEDGTGNGTTNINYQVKTVNKSYTVPNSTSTISWTAGFVNVTEVEFEAESATGSLKYESKAAQKLNLFTTLPPLGTVAVPAGTYTNVDFEIEFGSTSTINAFEISGMYNSTPIVFRIIDGGENEVEAELANVTLMRDKTYSAMITLDFSKLTLGITAAELNSAPRDNTGAIVILDNSGTGSLYSKMKNNLHKFVATVDFQ